MPREATRNKVLPIVRPARPCLRLICVLASSSPCRQKGQLTSVHISSCPGGALPIDSLHIGAAHRGIWMDTRSGARGRWRPLDEGSKEERWQREKGPWLV